MGEHKVDTQRQFPGEVRERIVDAIWVNGPPVRLFNSIFEITETHLQRCYFNDALKRYKVSRGKKVGGYGCTTLSQVFRDINRRYYEHMLVGIRRVIGGCHDRLDSGPGSAKSTYSLCAVLNELAGFESLISKDYGFQIGNLRQRNVGRRVSKTTRMVKMTKVIKLPHVLMGSFCLLKRALLKDVELLLEITNKHIAHLASDSSMKVSKVPGVIKFHISDKDIERKLKRIIDVYDVLEHLFQPGVTWGLTREDPAALKSYESFFGVAHVSTKSRSIRTNLSQKIDSWRHGDLTSGLTRRASFARLDLQVDGCSYKRCRVHPASGPKNKRG